MKKKFENFLKQMGDSPKRKGIFQLTSPICDVLRSEAEAFEKAAAGYSVLYDVHVFL